MKNTNTNLVRAVPLWVYSKQKADPSVKPNAALVEIHLTNELLNIDQKLLFLVTHETSVQNSEGSIPLNELASKLNSSDRVASFRRSRNGMLFYTSKIYVSNYPIVSLLQKQDTLETVDEAVATAFELFESIDLKTFKYEHIEEEHDEISRLLVSLQLLKIPSYPSLSISYM